MAMPELRVIQGGRSRIHEGIRRPNGTKNPRHRPVPENPLSVGQIALDRATADGKAITDVQRQVYEQLKTLVLDDAEEQDFVVDTFVNSFKKLIAKKLEDFLDGVELIESQRVEDSEGNSQLSLCFRERTAKHYHFVTTIGELQNKVEEEGYLFHARVSEAKLLEGTGSMIMRTGGAPKKGVGAKAKRFTDLVIDFNKKEARFEDPRTRLSEEAKRKALEEELRKKRTEEARLAVQSGQPIHPAKMPSSQNPSSIAVQASKPR